MSGCPTYRHAKIDQWIQVVTASFFQCKVFHPLFISCVIYYYYLHLKQLFYWDSQVVILHSCHYFFCMFDWNILVAKVEPFLIDLGIW